MIPTFGDRAPDPGKVFRADALDGRTLLVTGASSGLGKGAAIALAAAGARLVLAGRDKDRLVETQGLLAPGKSHAVAAFDILSADETAAAIKDLAKREGPFDGIFHAAGAYMAMPLQATRQKHLDAMFSASVWGGYGVARAAASRGVLADGGALALMSSVAAEHGNIGTAAYAGAKAAILGLVKVAAVELAPRRVRVNAILSSTIESEMHLKTIASLPNEKPVLQGLARHPMGFGTPSDIGAVVVFLMSEASRWITGTALAVDGGYSAY